MCWQGTFQIDLTLAGLYLVLQQAIKVGCCFKSDQLLHSDKHTTTYYHRGTTKCGQNKMHGIQMAVTYNQFKLKVIYLAKMQT
jgi:hypothetical protein